MDLSFLVTQRPFRSLSLKIVLFLFVQKPFHSPIISCHQRAFVTKRSFHSLSPRDHFSHCCPKTLSLLSPMIRPFHSLLPKELFTLSPKTLSFIVTQRSFHPLSLKEPLNPLSPKNSLSFIPCHPKSLSFMVTQRSFNCLPSPKDFLIHCHSKTHNFLVAQRPFHSPFILVTQRPFNSLSPKNCFIPCHLKIVSFIVTQRPFHLLSPQNGLNFATLRFFHTLVKGTQMGPLLVLVFPCFREHINVASKIVFLCSLANFLLKNVIVFFFGNQIWKWRSFEKSDIFLPTFHNF